MDQTDYVEVTVDNISLINSNFIIFLRQQEATEVLPICIGITEAHSIAAAYKNQPFPRPLTHDLMKNILTTLECGIDRICVNDLRDGTFYARIFLDTGGVSHEIDARPSDAIAMALRYHAPIFVREDILRENSVHVQQAQEKADASLMESEGETASATAASPRERLKQELEQAVAREDYERAAQLRDRLRGLESEQ